MRGRCALLKKIERGTNANKRKKGTVIRTPLTYSPYPDERCDRNVLGTRRLQRDAVTLRVAKHAELVDVADVPRRELQRDITLELGNPKPARLNVHVLPALRLDVRVGDVLRQKLSFPSDIALRHDFLEWPHAPACARC
jgi:hypothetical protein